MRFLRVLGAEFGKGSALSTCLLYMTIILVVHFFALLDVSETFFLIHVCISLLLETLYILVLFSSTMVYPICILTPAVFLFLSHPNVHVSPPLFYFSALLPYYSCSTPLPASLSIHSAFGYSYFYYLCFLLWSDNNCINTYQIVTAEMQFPPKSNLHCDWSSDTVEISHSASVLTAVAQ